MATPKKQTASYSAWLRQRRQARGRSSAAAPGAVHIGRWTLADEAGALVITNRATGAKTVLMNGGGESTG